MCGASLLPVGPQSLAVLNKGCGQVCARREHLAICVEVKKAVSSCFIVGMGDKPSAHLMATACLEDSKYFMWFIQFCLLGGGNGWLKNTKGWSCYIVRPSPGPPLLSITHNAAGVTQRRFEKGRTQYPRKHFNDVLPRMRSC